MSAPIPNTDAAIEFLEWLEPEGPWLLTAIDPDPDPDPKRRGNSIETRCFDDPALMRRWIERWQGKRNIYYSLNRTKPGLTKKATKAEITEMVALHVDVDPPKVPLDLAALAAAQASILDEVKAHDKPPSAIIFSGNGYQPLWRLDVPEPVVRTGGWRAVEPGEVLPPGLQIEMDLTTGRQSVFDPKITESRIEELEAYNIALARALAGGDACHNIDRILRVPGTINLPDKRKRDLGRVPALAKLVYFSERVYSLADFTPARGGTGDPPPPPPGGDPPDVFAGKPPISDGLKQLIREPDYSRFPDNQGRPDRNRAVWAAILGLVKAYWTDAQIIAALTNPQNGISAHNLNHGTEKPADYVRRQIKRARDEVAEQRQGGQSRTLFWRHLRDMPEPDYIIKGVIDRGTLVEVYGPHSSGKSFFVTDVGLHIVFGWGWRGRRVRQGGVLYVSAEGGARIKRRLQAFAKHHKVVLDTVPFGSVIAPTNLLSDEGINQIIVDARAVPDVAVIIIDTAARTMPGGKEDTEDMGRFISACETIRDATGCTVIIVHHTGKDASRGSRGAVRLPDAADTIIAINGKATVEKQRDGEIGAEFPFKLRVVDLGEDADGDKVTSCVVEEGEPAAEKRTGKARLTGPQRIALEQLRNAIINDGVILPEGRHVPANTRGVKKALWLEYCLNAGMLGDSEDPKKAREAGRKVFNRAVVDLKTAAPPMVGVWEPYVWIAP
jgi:hypothetical protein